MFYTNCDPDNPTTQQIRQINRANIHLYDQLHNVNLEEDYEVHMTIIAAVLGTSKRQAEQTFIIKFMLDRLPKFKSLALELGHLDRPHLAAAAETLFSGIDEQYLPQLDKKLAEFLTPTKCNQQLPSPRRIKARVRDWLRELDPEWELDKDPPDSHLEIKHVEETTFINAEYPVAVGRELHEIIRAAADKYHLSMADALVSLLRGQATVNVTLNLFGDPETSYLDGVGWLESAEAEEWFCRVTKTRDLTNTQWERSGGYRPSQSMRAYVEGRDGTCRYPGCHVPASRCDVDHVVPWPEGSTTPANLQSLCRHHHNCKTDGRVSAEIDENADVTWKLSENTEIVSSPTGPLAQHSAKWGCSLRKWIDKRSA